MKQDVDRLLSYETKQQVNILDKWLGFANVGFQLCILTYIVGFVFVYDNGYLGFEHARGITTTHVNKGSDVVVQSSGKIVGSSCIFILKLSTTERLHPGFSVFSLKLDDRVIIQ